MIFVLKEKWTYLFQNNSNILVVIEKEEKQGSGYFFKCEVYSRDMKTGYYQFVLRNVKRIFAYSFNEAYCKLNDKLASLIYNY